MYGRTTKEVSISLIPMRSANTNLWQNKLSFFCWLSEADIGEEFSHKKKKNQEKCSSHRDNIMAE